MGLPFEQLVTRDLPSRELPDTRFTVGRCWDHGERTAVPGPIGGREEGEVGYGGEG